MRLDVERDADPSGTSSFQVVRLFQRGGPESVMIKFAL